MRALVCHTFAGYDFDAVDSMCADELAEAAGAALWVREQENKGVKRSSSPKVGKSGRY